MDKTELLEFHNEYLEEIKERGISDGKMNQPHFEDTILSPYEKKIAANYKFQAAVLKSNFADKVANVSQEKEDALREELKSLDGKDYKEVIATEEARVNEEILKEKDKNAAEMKSLENTPSYIAAKENHKKVNNDFKRQSKELGRSYTDKVLPTWAYGIIMMAIAIGEIAFNFNAFIGLGDNKVFGMISAIGVNFGLVLIFHVIGDFLKRKHEVNNAPQAIAILMVIALGVITGMAYIREGHFGLFFAIGAMLMAVGVTMSWLNHDSNREFEQLLGDKSIVSNDLEAEIQKVNKLKDDENARWKSVTQRLLDGLKTYTDEVEAILQNKQKEIDSLVVRRSAVKEEYKEQINEVNMLYQVAVQTYREENYAYRNDSKQVIAWKNELEPLNV